MKPYNPPGSFEFNENTDNNPPSGECSNCNTTRAAQPSHVRQWLSWDMLKKLVTHCQSSQYYKYQAGGF